MQTAAPSARRAAPQLPAVLEETGQSAAAPRGPWSKSPSSLQLRSCCCCAAPPPPALLQTSKEVECPTFIGRAHLLVQDFIIRRLQVLKLLVCLDAGCERKTPFLQAYEQRYIALEVYYLGWQYHGFASQTDTQATVEVPAPLACSETDR